MISCCSAVCYFCLFTKQGTQCNTCGLPWKISKNIDVQIIDCLHKVKYLEGLQPAPKTFPSSQPCIICKNSQSEYSVKGLSKGICGHCSEFNILRRSNNLRCSSNHLLFDTDDSFNKGRCYFCSISSNLKTHCFECGIHFCTKCSRLLNSVVLAIRYLKCPCQGEIVWHSFKGCESCSECKNSYRKIGIFCCAKCEKIRCFYCVLLLFDTLYCVSCLTEFDRNNLPKISNFELFCRNCCEGVESFESKELNIISMSMCRGSHELQQIEIKDTSKAKGIFKPCQNCPFIFSLSYQEWIANSLACPNFRCLKGHYPRKTDIFESFHKTSNVRCRTCSETIKEISVYCISCPVDQCENCYEFIKGLRSTKQAIRCICNYKYLLVSELPCSRCMICQKAYKESGCFYCKKCKKSICIPCGKKISEGSCGKCKANGTETILKQLSCGHYLCVACFDEIMVTPLSTCPIDEALLNQVSDIPETRCTVHYFINDSKYGVTCSLCKKEKNNLGYCRNCFFVACEPCQIWHIESMPLQDNLTCCAGHPLRLTPRAERFYKRSGKYKCDGCLKLRSGNSLHCLTCSVDYCEGCYNNIKTAQSFYSVFNCSCGGNVVWNHLKAGSKCSGCKEKFQKSGFFECGKCRKIICASCGVKGRKESCYYCLREFLANRLKAAQTEFGYVSCEGCLKTVRNQILK